MNDQRHFLYAFVLDEEVKPLVVGLSVCVRPNIEVIVLVLF
jgi:hypothetical protein